MTSDTSISFESLGVKPAIASVLKDLGYEAPTPIQEKSIPILLSGHDLLGQAQTGTGKTAAFALPLLGKIDLSSRAPQVLVLTPTRELAIQVSEAFQTYARKLNSFHVLPIYGGQSMGNQLHRLRRGVQVVVGTPGRVMDHLRRKSLKLVDLKALVLDEADEMLNMGFIEDIEWILEHTPDEKQIALFSATMPPAIRKVAGKYLKDEQEVRIKSKTSTVDTTSQHFWLVSGLHKLDAITRILEVEEFDAALIFVRTKTATVELAEKLEARGHSTAALNGDLGQELRERTVERMKKGDLDIIVATDVAARGLHVDRISHVINYDIPHDPEAYVHRIGRTGRAGRSGKAILFVSPRERRLLRAIENTTRQRIEPLQLPTTKDLSSRRILRFKETISETVKKEELTFYSQIIDELAYENDTSATDIAAALCFLSQKDNPFIIKEAKVPSARRNERGDSTRRDSNRRGSERRSTERNRFGEGQRERSDEPRRKFGGRDGGVEPGMVRYRIEVGRVHDVAPGNIVGAIANFADIDSQFIGRIQLQDEFSTVDLPEGMPKDIFQNLKNLRINGRLLKMSVAGSGRKATPGTKQNRTTRKSASKNGGSERRRQRPKKAGARDNRKKKRANA